ncbi:NAD(P)-binding protein [Dentipellis sp. KUC8613]|nr:NAD(P)-binding protein [Dentipellis sp. KUC8613]
MSSASKTVNPVAIFVGGTSGIGQGMAEALNRDTKGRAHIVLVGRNREAAEVIIKDMKAAVEPSSDNGGSYSFVECDVSLLSHVKPCAAQLRAQYPKIDFLILTAGFMSPSRDAQTPEGLDKKLAIQYYARWAFIETLIPSLRAAGSGKVLTVFGAGNGEAVDVEDFGFVKRTGPVAKAGATYNDLMCESFALRNPGVTLAHANPGGVRTNLLRSSPSLLLRAMQYTLPLMTPFTHSQDECAAYMWSGLRAAKPEAGSAGVLGAWRFGSKGQDLRKHAHYGTKEEREALWRHTAKVVGLGGEGETVS